MIYMVRFFKSRNNPDRLQICFERERLGFWSFGKILSYKYENSSEADDYDAEHLMDENSEPVLRPHESYATTKIVDSDDPDDSAIIAALLKADASGIDRLDAETWEPIE